MCDRLHLNSIQQTKTPLNSLFFSEFNVNILQRAIRQSFKNDTGISIDYQNSSDIFAIMRSVFINNSGDHNSRVNEQVKKMNQIVINTATQQIRSGVASYLGYIKDIDSVAIPPNLPQNTSTYGRKMEMLSLIHI